MNTEFNPQDPSKKIVMAIDCMFLQSQHRGASDREASGGFLASTLTYPMRRMAAKIPSDNLWPSYMHKACMSVMSKHT